MAIEIERKYRVCNHALKDVLSAGDSKNKPFRQKVIKQAYLDEADGWLVTVRLSEATAQLMLSNGAVGIAPHAFVIPKDEGVQLLSSDNDAQLNDGKVSLERWTLRVRVFVDGTGEICLKERVSGDTRGEVEAPIMGPLANRLFDTSSVKVHKVRHYIEHVGYTWEVDVFQGDNVGLITAELETADNDYPLPDFVQDELTDKPEYFNEALARHPYNRWR